MKGREFWIIMAVVALLAWFGVRYFAQTVSETVTGEAPVTVVIRTT